MFSDSIQKMLNSSSIDSAQKRVAQIETLIAQKTQQLSPLNKTEKSNVRCKLNHNKRGEILRFPEKKITRGLPTSGFLLESGTCIGSDAIVNLRSR